MPPELSAAQLMAADGDALIEWAWLQMLEEFDSEPGTEEREQEHDRRQFNATLGAQLAIARQLGGIRKHLEKLAERGGVIVINNGVPGPPVTP